jgi:signal transduction histidine kinase
MLASAMSIRNRLLLLVLSVLLPALLAALLAVWFVYKEQQAAQKISLAETTHTFSLLIDNELQTTTGVLKALSNAPSLGRKDFDEFKAYAQRISPPEDSAIVLSNLAGQQLLNTRAPAGSPLPKVNAAVMEQRAQHGNDKIIVSDVFFAPIGKRHDFAVEVPVLQDGEVRFRLAMGLATERLQPLLAQQNFPADWVVVVVDRKGTVVARSRSHDKFVGKTVTPDLLKRIVAREKSGVHYGTTLDGIETAGFFSRSPESEWTVILNIPVAELRRPAIHAALLLGAIMTLLLAGAIAIARWYASRTANPIENLRLAAEQLGRGEPFALRPSGLAETDMVGHALQQADAQIRRNRQELQARVTEAVMKAESAQRALMQAQKLEALGRLTGGIAHDFNNILQTLSTALQLIRFTNDPGRIQTLAETCERAIDRATQLTGQMRAFGKVQEACLETVSLHEATANVIPLLKNALPSNIAFSFELGEELWPVTVDRLQLELALLNIVINARDAMPAGGMIHIDMHNERLQKDLHSLPAGDYVRIGLSDTGAGMSREILAQALEPFFTTKPVDKGTGLGLAQAYGFASQSGGTLHLDSLEGVGTVVTILLPKASLDSVGSSPLSGTVNVSPALASGTVLLVEDDSLVREAVASALSNAGFCVLEAGTADEALTLFDKNADISFLLSDIVMPGQMSGVDLARAVQARFPEVRIVLATGYTEIDIDLPGVRVLGKPYEINEAVHALTRTA